MRVVHRRRRSSTHKLDEAQREAGAAFGRADVFLERYIARAKHIEVQILGDAHGNLVHLWERDCSVQRRHQKVVEVAPSIEPRRRSCGSGSATRPSRLCRSVGYRNAGTVEFLLDVDRGEFYFIEVNPRIQVEHTVTEMVTGIDLVRSQILVAAGPPAARRAAQHPAAGRRSSARGVAMQCRDHDRGSRNHFIPDYGRITTYRSAGGFAVRLDGGNGFGGAVITPYFDSLLVKVTTWGGDARGSGAARRPRAARVPHPRRQDQHPVPAEPDRPPDVPAGRGDDDVHRRHARAVPLPRAARPRDEDAHLPRRRDRQRPAGREGGSSTRAAAGRRRRAAGLARPTRRRRARGRSCWSWARSASRVGARAEAAAAHRHDDARRAPVAAGDARAHLRHAGGRRRDGAADARTCSASRCGAARRSTRRCGSSRKTRGSGSTELRAADPEHPVPDAAAGEQRRRLHELSRQRRARVRQAQRRSTGSTSSASSTR